MDDLAAQLNAGHEFVCTCVEDGEFEFYGWHEQEMSEAELDAEKETCKRDLLFNIETAKRKLADLELKLNSL